MVAQERGNWLQHQRGNAGAGHAHDSGPLLVKTPAEARFIPNAEGNKILLRLS